MFKLVNGVSVLLTQEEIDDFKQRELNHKQEAENYKTVEYKDLRRREYPTLEDIVVALIEKEEGRPDSLNALMALRAQIKVKYPKP